MSTDFNVIVQDSWRRGKVIADFAHSEFGPEYISLLTGAMAVGRDRQAYEMGGTSRVLQVHVVKQIACLTIMELVAEHVIKWKGSKGVCLACDWGKHYCVVVPRLVI